MNLERNQAWQDRPTLVFKARSDLAWAISIGGIGVVRIRGLLLFSLVFRRDAVSDLRRMLLGVALNAMTNLLGRVVQAAAFAAADDRLPGAGGAVVRRIFLGGTTIAQQATALSDTIKSQLVNVKAFLERNGIDTSYLELGNPCRDRRGNADTAQAGAAPPHNLPSAGRSPPAAARSSARP